MKLNDMPILHKFFGTDPRKEGTVQPKEVLSYSFAGFGQNIICQLVTTFFMIYLTDVAKISPLWLAWMFLAARLFDAFNDPIMGSIVDKTKSKWGKMRPYLLFTPIPIAIFTVLLFTTPSTATTEMKFAYSTVIYLLWGVSYTIVDVPYWGLASSLTKDTDQRNTLLTVARLICTIGSGLVSVAIPIITGLDYFKTNPDSLSVAYLLIAIVAVFIAVPTFWIGFKNTRERYYEENAQKESLGESLKLLMKNKPLLLLILVGVLGGLRTIYMTTAVYYANYSLGNLGLAGLIFLLVVPGGLIATLLTPVLSKKFGKRDLFIYTHLLGGVLMIILYFIGFKSNGTSTVSQIFFYIIVIFAGVPSGFSNILTYSMIGDSIDYLEDKTGKRAEGICYAMQTLISKIGMALTAFVTLLVLGKYGYDAEFLKGFQGALQDGLTIKQIMDSGKYAGLLNVQKGVWLATTLLGGLSMAACAIPLFFYKFTEEEQRKAVLRIAERKHQHLAEFDVLDAEGNVISSGGVAVEGNAVKDEIKVESYAQEIIEVAPSDQTDDSKEIE